MTKSINYISGIILSTFVAIHLTNHILILAGPEYHLSFMDDARIFYRNILVEILILLSVAAQTILGIFLFLRRRKSTESVYERYRIYSGFYLSIFLVLHLSAIIVGRFFLHLDTNLYYGAEGMNQFPQLLFLYLIMD